MSKSPMRIRWPLLRWLTNESPPTLHGSINPVGDSFWEEMTGADQAPQNVVVGGRTPHRGYLALVDKDSCVFEGSSMVDMS